MRRRSAVRGVAMLMAVAFVGGLSIARGAGASTTTSQSRPPVGPDDYVVVFHDWVGDPRAVSAEHARTQGAQVRFVYEHALKGYAATISEQGVRGVRRDPRVDYVEADGVATVVHHRPGHVRDSDTTTTTTTAPGGVTTACEPSGQTLPWGIDKVDADTSSTIAGNGCGAVGNVHVYVIDTGVDTAHGDLNVVGHVNYANGPNTDCHGHGTHVAGTIAAEDNSQDVVGVAPGAPVVGVKVLGCSGSGTWSGVIAGVDWVTANAKKPAIANMSLGGGAKQSVDDAVKTSADSGVLYSIAAGNDGANACNYSPARAGTHDGVVTTAATTSTDAETSWSNYGACVDLWAPGASILSTRKDGGTTTMSGTSMAAPHVGGGGALWLSSHTGASPATVESALKSAATTTAKKSKDGRTVIRLYVGAF